MDLFDKDKRNHDGRGNVCKSCRSKAVRGKYTGSLRHRAGALYQRARYRAEAKGLDISISPEWVEEILKQGVCQATGLPFDFSLGHIRNLYAPSLDQVVAGAGYTKDNTKVVLFGYNAAKSTVSHDEVAAFFKRVAGNL